MENKKVLFVISSLNTGGAQRAVSNITSNFPDDWTIDILLNSSENITYPYKGNIISLGIKEPKDRSSINYQLKVLIRRIFKLYELKKTRNYKACISFLTSANIVNVLTGNKHCKTIISTRSNLSLQKEITNIPFLTDILGYIFNKADTHIALSEGVKIDLCQNIKCSKEKVKVIYNGYNVEEIVEKSFDNEEDYNEYDIITMGRLTDQKNQWHLIRCISALKEKYPDIKCLIIGDGVHENYFREMIKSGGLENNVFLAGFLSNPFAQLSKGKVFVFPSAWEGFGNVVIEAMSLGLPCVLSDYRYGAREIIAPNMDVCEEITNRIVCADYGILTPVCSGNKYEINEPLELQEQLLCEAIEVLFDETKRSIYSELSKSRALDFDIKSVVNKWIEEIEKE